MSDNEEKHYLAIDYIEEGTMPPERRANLRALLAELRELRAAKAEPPTIDREALAKVMFLWDISENINQPKWEKLNESQRDVWREGADAVIAHLSAREVAGDDPPYPGCTGAGDCDAPAHEHGCFSDLLGHCNNPEEHRAQEAATEVEQITVVNVNDIPAEHHLFGSVAKARANADVMDADWAYGASGPHRVMRRTVTPWQEVPADEAL